MFIVHYNICYSVQYEYNKRAKSLFAPYMNVYFPK